MKKISVMLMALVLTITMSANKFVKVTSAPEDWNGQYLLAWDAGDSVLVFNGKDEGHDYVKVTAADGVITGEYNTCVVEIAAMTGGYALKLVEQGKFMGGKTTNDNGLVFSIDPVLNTLALAEGLVTVTSNSKLFVFNSTSGTNNMRFRYYKSSTAAADVYKKVSFYKAETPYSPDPWTPDTISVSEAKRLIRDSVKGDDGKLLMNKSHYVKGVVSNPNFGNSWPGYAIVWMRDIDNELDTIEGYKIYKDGNSTNWASAEDIPFGYCDTVLMYADGLMHYKNEKTDVDEISSGYYAQMLGKAQLLDANAIFKFGVGARQWGAAFDGVRYKYELILSKSNEEDYDNAVHMIINTNVARGIAGKYTVKNYQNDSSYVDGEGPISGSVELGYVEEAGQLNNKYTMKGDFSLNGVIYHLDTIYNLSGLDFDTYEQFKLSDDVPYVPKEGDTLTCAEAKKYALSVLAENETSKVNVVIIGYANNVGNVSENQQTFYLDDESAGTAKIIQSYWGNLTNLKQVTNGAKVLLYGKLMHYVSGSDHVAEIKNGDVVVLEGGEPFERDITLEPVPDGAITVAEAKQLADQLGANDTSDVVIVKGYVTSLYNSYNTKYKSQSFYMNDVNDPNSKSYFEAFQCGLAAPTMVGDFVWVEGRLVKYIKENGEVNYNLVKGNGHFDTLSTDLVKVMNNMPQNSVQKVFYKGNIYIVRDGVIRNVHGAVIR